MNIIATARKVERRLARSVDAAIGELVGRSAPASIEIVHAVLELAEERVQEIGHGRRVFPFNRVLVHVLAPPDDREIRPRVEAVVQGPPSLADRLCERLRALACQPERLTAQVTFAATAGPDWQAPDFHVEFQKVASRNAYPRQVRAQPLQLRLVPVSGVTVRRTYCFQAGRIDIGRGGEVLDSRQRVTRTNQVVFPDDDSAVNRTVSRRHAHVIFTPAASEYRICDDRSVHGTAVIRDGRTIPVPPGARGVRLRSDDEIVLGRARLRVTIEPAVGRTAVTAPARRSLP